VDSHALQGPGELPHAGADRAPVGLQLGLARSPGADTAAEALEVLPLPDQPRHQVGQLRQLHLQLALARACSLGEDVEDQRGPVDDLQTQALAQVPLLHGRQRVVGDEEVGRESTGRLADLLHLSAAKVERG
jgi:hypothetical protein